MKPALRSVHADKEVQPIVLLRDAICRDKTTAIPRGEFEEHAQTRVRERKQKEGNHCYGIIGLQQEERENFRLTAEKPVIRIEENHLRVSQTKNEFGYIFSQSANLSPLPP